MGKMLSARQLWLLFILLLQGCESEGVMGIPDELLLSSDGDPGVTVPSPGSSTPAIYEKAENIWVDAYYLGGRSFRESRAEISSQLGALIGTRSLAEGRGEELQFARGSIRVIDDRVAMIRVPLAEPMRRSEALQATGFPIMVDTWMATHREYRLNHEWSFRRLRLKRLGPESEYVSSVEAWKWIPGEHGARR
jgi:hypothetical protein